MNIKNLWAVTINGEIHNVLSSRKLARLSKASLGGKIAGVAIIKMQAQGEVS